MSKRTVKIKFVDYCTGCDPTKEPLYRLLQPYYDLVLCDDPDYIFCAGFGHEHLNYHCVKIFQTGENYVPDFNLYDYAMGCQYIEFGERYFRLPHFTAYDEFSRLDDPRDRRTDEELLCREFCSFVVSNSNCDPLRDDFFEELSRYKKVDSGGRHKNNIGGPVSNKLDFVGKHKFNIAIENSVSPGYTTEKIMQPLAVQSVPIYFGDPLVDREFNPEAFVWIRSRSDINRAIDEVIQLDQDDSMYLKKCRAKPMLHGSAREYADNVTAFLRHIFELPLCDAHQIATFGWQAGIAPSMKRLHDLDDGIQCLNNACKAPFRAIRKGFARVCKRGCV